MLIRVDRLQKNYKTGIINPRVYCVVENASFTVSSGETLGLIGESGCGKSTLARTMLGLTPPSGGKVFLNEKEVLKKTGKIKKEFCGKMQIIFQHPESALNPRMKIRQSLIEPRLIQKLDTGKKYRKEVIPNLLKQVGLNEEHLTRYPHELSGGQIQRVVFARILSLNPEFLVADEPTSMLDVSVQAQVLHILKVNQKKHGLGLLFISHDLDIVRWMSDRIAVMYKGQIVEIAPAECLCNNPKHPYSQLLVESFLSFNQCSTTKKETNQGDYQDACTDSCHYFDHCSQSEAMCRKQPVLKECSPGHLVACWKV